MFKVIFKALSQTSEMKDKAGSIWLYWNLCFWDRPEKGSDCKWKNDASVMLVTQLVNINMQVIRLLSAINYFSISRYSMGKTLLSHSTSILLANSFPCSQREIRGYLLFAFHWEKVLTVIGVCWHITGLCEETVFPVNHQLKVLVLTLFLSEF